MFLLFLCFLRLLVTSWVRSAFLNQRAEAMHSPYNVVPSNKETTTSSTVPKCTSPPHPIHLASPYPTHTIQFHSHFRWITNSYEAEIFLVFANVDPSKGYKGITCFIVDKDMGIQIAKKEQKLGIRASSTCTLSFDDMKVPAANVIGGVGQGYKVRLSLHSHLLSYPISRPSFRSPIPAPLEDSPCRKNRRKKED